MERISQAFHGPRHGPGCSCGTRHMGTWDTAHGHTGTRAHDGHTAHGAPRERKQSFIQEDKDASAEWGGAQFYELSYAILFHPKLGFNEGELVEKKGID